MNKLNINKVNIFLQLSFFVVIFTTTVSEGCDCLRSQKIGANQPLIAQSNKESFCNRLLGISVAPTQYFMPNRDPILTVLTGNNFDIDSSQFNFLETLMIERPENSTIAIQSIPVSKIEWENLNSGSITSISSGIKYTKYPFVKSENPQGYTFRLTKIDDKSYKVEFFSN